MGACILCGREIATDREGQYCCSGCEAVAQILDSMDLSNDERKERTERLLKAVFPTTEENKSDIEVAREHLKDASLLVSGMVCPACSWIIHHTLDQTDGVVDANVNFIAETCTVSYDPMRVGLEDIEESIRSLGYKAVTDTGAGKGHDYYAFGAGWFLAANVMMLSYVVYVAEFLSIPRPMEYVISAILLVFSVLTVAIAGRDIIRKAIGQIRRFQFRMETLILLSTTTAFLYSIHALIRLDFAHLYFDVVAMLIMLVETGNLIQASFYRKLRRRVEELKGSLPKKVRIAGTGPDAYKAIPELSPGECFIVKHEELVPADGVLLEDAEFDFSLINGESRGVTLREGQFVGAGAKLLSESSRLAVPAKGASSLIGDIVESTVSAFNTQQDRPSAGDRISQYFVPIVFAIAVIGAAFYLLQGETGDGVLTFMRVLIVACPCAFGIAEPLVLTIAVDRFKRMGVQVFNGSALRHVPTDVIFDKTGTLTKARLTVQTTHWLVPEDQRLLDVLASLEAGIEHPVARALNALGAGVPVEDRVIEVGRVAGKVDGKLYRTGKLSLFPDAAVPDELARETVSLVGFGDADKCLLVIALGDEVREESADLVKGIMDRGIDVHICSGDRAPIVEHVATELGIRNFNSEMTPADKQEYISKLHAEGKRVMMIGDGINDAQSLAASDFGVAVCSGQIPAQMSADAVLLTPDLSPLRKMFDLLGAVRRRVIYNYSWALGYNIIGIGLALSGRLAPTFCAVGMAFSNIIVIYNSMRMGRKMK